MSEETIVDTREELNRGRAEALDALIQAAENAAPAAPPSWIPYDAANPRCEGWSGVEWGKEDFSPNGPNFLIDVNSLTQKVLADKMLLELIPSEWKYGIPQEGKAWATAWGEADLADKRKRLADLTKAMAPLTVAVPNLGKQLDSYPIERIVRGEFKVMSDDGRDIVIHTTPEKYQLRQALTNYYLRMNESHDRRFCKEFIVMDEDIRSSLNSILSTQNNRQMNDVYREKLAPSDTVMDNRYIFAALATAGYTDAKIFKIFLGVATATLETYGLRFFLDIKSFDDLASVLPLKAAAENFCALLGFVFGVAARNIFREVFESFLLTSYQVSDLDLHVFMLHAFDSALVQYQLVMRGRQTDRTNPPSYLRDMSGPDKYKSVLEETFATYMSLRHEAVTRFTASPAGKAYVKLLLELPCVVAAASRKPAVVTVSAASTSPKRVRDTSPQADRSPKKPAATGSTAGKRKTPQSSEPCIAHLCTSLRIPKVGKCPWENEPDQCLWSHAKVTERARAYELIENSPAKSLKDSDIRNVALGIVQTSKLLERP